MRAERTIQGKKCYIYGSGESEALLIQPIDAHDLELLDQEIAIIQGLTHTPFRLVAFLIEDWNQELSPWKAPAVFGKGDFGSGAADTLSFITDSLLPELGVDKKVKCYIGGYSLSGLFALWAGHRTDRFCGVAAVSPSVWFPGWARYMESNPIHSPEVYLSLGDKEERTRNQIMASVGANIRRQYEVLLNTDEVSRCVLEWNKGNHFVDSERRMAKGFAWLLNGSDE